MAFEIHTWDIDGRSCWLCVPASPSAGEQLPLAIMPAGDEITAVLPRILEDVGQAIAAETCRPFILAGFDSADWARELTPWPAPPLSKRGRPFPGEAAATLRWLQERFIPAVESRCPLPPGRRDRSILGYSLGGLFALWAFLESGVFGCCASCSGSLWYNGWMDYVSQRQTPPNSRVYLSLGVAEEAVRNPYMAAVGDVTREYAGRLKADPSCSETALVWQKGGHFHDVPSRLADALLWLMKR